MKRIILSILAIALTVGSVSGAAYALFSTTATVQGVTINSGNAALNFDVGLTSVVNGGSSLDLASFSTSFPNIYPGFSQNGSLWLMNVSQSNIALHVTGRLTSATTWDPVLANAIWINVVAKNGYGAGPYTVTGSQTAYETGWQSLATWNTSDVAFPTDIPHTMPSGHWGYDVYMMVDPSAGNAISLKTLGGIVFTLTGTQVQ